MLSLEYIKRALEAAACDLSHAAASPQLLHTARSRQWVNCLASELKALHPDRHVRVFFKGNAENQAEFGLDELLYDVCICETDTCPSTPPMRLTSGSRRVKAAASAGLANVYVSTTSWNTR